MGKIKREEREGEGDGKKLKEWYTEKGKEDREKEGLKRGRN